MNTRMVPCTLAHFLSLNRRARKPAQHRAIKRWKAYRNAIRPFTIDPRSTRDELFARCREKLRLMRALRRGGHMAYSHRQTVEVLSAVAALRSAALAQHRVDSTNRAFYVSIQDGAKYGLLYGPLPTQAAALRALPEVKLVARSVNGADAAFASFGTCSVAIDKARPGTLNSLLPPIGAPINELAATA